MLVSMRATMVVSFQAQNRHRPAVDHSMVTIMDRLNLVDVNRTLLLMYIGRDKAGRYRASIVRYRKLVFNVVSTYSTFHLRKEAFAF